MIGMADGAMGDIDENSHGGNLRLYSGLSGFDPCAILDFSANLNPMGPPPWVADAVAQGLAEVGRYPDPEETRARQAASTRFGLPAERFLFADGADSLIFALPRAFGVTTVLAFQPCYSGYIRAAHRAGARFLPVCLDEAKGYAQDPAAMAEALLAQGREGSTPGAGPCLVFIGSPNNPVGATLPADALCDIARGFPSALFAVDESFAELAGQGDGLVGRLPDNCLVLRSLTKTWSIPGIRVGLVEARPTLLRGIRGELPAWPLSSFGEASAVMAMADREWGAKGARRVAEIRPDFAASLEAIPGLRVFPAEANFLFLKLDVGLSAKALQASLLAEGIAIRTFSRSEGLDDRYLRLAVRLPPENDRLVQALGLHMGRMRP